METDSSSGKITNKPAMEAILDKLESDITNFKSMMNSNSVISKSDADNISQRFEGIVSRIKAALAGDSVGSSTHQPYYNLTGAVMDGQSLCTDIYKLLGTYNG